MTRETIIAKLYVDPDILRAIGKMHPVELQDDLRQEMFLVICEMPEAKFIDYYERGIVKFFLIRTMLNMIKSDRSTFHKKFRQQVTEWIEIYDRKDDPCDGDMDAKINQCMSELHWYEREVFREYSESKNILKLSRDTTIPYRSLFKTITKVKKKMKSGLRNENVAKLIGKTLTLQIDISVDILNDMDTDMTLDLIDEIKEVISEKIIDKRLTGDAIITTVSDPKIKNLL